MKLQYMCLDSALDLWPPGHFALEFFVSLRCADFGLLTCAINSFLFLFFYSMVQPVRENDTSY